MSSVEVTSLEKLLSWKLSELKKACKEYGIGSSGTKAELAERLHMHHVTAAEQAANSELNEAELLGELDESVEAAPKPAEPEAEAPKAAAAAAPKAAAKAAKTAKPGIKRKAAPEKKPAPAPAAAAEAAAEKSKPKEPTAEVVKPPCESEEPKEAAVENGAANAASPDAKVPFSKMSEEERKLARAKRFGLSPDGSSGSQSISQLEKRAARFGEVLAPTLQKTLETEKLQKRLERFGETSGKSSSLSEEDKKRKRQERFGISASGDEKKSSYDEEERKRRRLERFGGAAAAVSVAPSAGTDAEKLARRADRFGIESEEAKKAARAKRFGVSA